MAVDLDDVIKLAEQLDTAQQNLLIYRLRVKQMTDRGSSETEQNEHGTEYVGSPTREELLHSVPEISEEQFHADLHAIATEWEQELDEFDSDES